MEKISEIICLCGFMACGKSTVGSRLAARLGCVFTDLDDYIVQRAGRSIVEIFKDGEAEFRKLELDSLKAYLEATQRQAVLALGGGTFTITEARKLALAKTRTIYLRTDLSTIRERVGASDASRPLFVDAERLYAERRAFYEQAEYTLDTDSLSPEELVSKIIDILSS